MPGLKSLRVSAKKRMNTYSVSLNSFGWKAVVFMATVKSIKTCEPPVSDVVKTEYAT
jgi:hypothetical protein